MRFQMQDTETGQSSKVNYAGRHKCHAGKEQGGTQRKTEKKGDRTERLLGTPESDAKLSKIIWLA